jgi:ATP-independent RNA helicase DbpA
VVGTPGRILDVLRKNALSLQSLKTLVLDEADRMLDMGFADDMLDIVEQTPAKRQTLLFSATMPDAIRDFSRRLQHKPIDVTVPEAQEISAIEQIFYDVEPEEKLDALVALLLKYRPESALVFCNTRDSVRTVAEELSERRFSVLALHGELEQREREEMLVRFANRSSNVLVASDVAARGLDIKELAMVINYDIATDNESHIHRIGRTGRAGSQGIALSLCSLSDTSRSIAIAKLPGQNVKRAKVPVVSSAVMPLYAPYVTLSIDAGRQDKLRPGDVLGALTGDAGIPGDAVGKIDIYPTRSYVAIARDWGDKA